MNTKYEIGEEVDHHIRTRGLGTLESMGGVSLDYLVNLILYTEW